MKPRYRIVFGSIGGYRIQVWRWFWPFWTTVGGWCVSIDLAEMAIRQHAQHVVKYVPYPDKSKAEP